MLRPLFQGGPRRRPARALWLIALLPLACAAPGGARAAAPDEVVVLLEAAPATLDPLLATDAYGVRISNQLLFDTLLTLDDALAPAPGLADQWRQVTPTRYRLRIRRGVRFHDGHPLTPADVVFTLQSLTAATGGSPNGAALRQKLRAVRALGADEVELDLNAPYASLLVDLIVPVRCRATPDAPFNGTGPFRLLRQTPTEIALERNLDYHGARPGPARVTFKVVQDENTRMLKFLKGDVDLAVNALPLDKLLQFRRAPLSGRYRVEEAPGLSYQYLGLNLADPILAQAKVRRALALAINVDALIKFRQKGHATRAAWLLPADSPYAAPGPPPRYDPAQAARLLDEAGFPLKDGRRFGLTYKTSTDRAAVIQARVIQSDLREIGVEVDVRAFEWATFYEDIQKGNFQLFSLRWIGVVDPDFQYELFHSSQLPPRGRNRGRYRNPEADRLLEAGRLETDPARRRALYRRLEGRLQDDLPYISLWHNNNIAIVSRRFDGFRLHPTGGFQHLAEMRPAAP